MEALGMNGNKIKVSAEKSWWQPDSNRISYYNYERMEAYMEVFDYCMRNTHGLRRLGSAAADLAYVACGRFEAFYEYGLNAWDVAGGIVLVKSRRISDGFFRWRKIIYSEKKFWAAMVLFMKIFPRNHG